jgi:hypothetical protein
MWPKDDGARIAKGFHPTFIGNPVAELNDLRDAPEMFDKTSSAPKRLTCEVVNGNLSVIQVGIRYSLKVLKDQVLDDPKVLPDGCWADLLMVTDDNG